MNAAQPPQQPEEAQTKKPARKRTRKPPNTENGAPKAPPKRSRGGSANSNNQNGPASMPNAQMAPSQGNFPGMAANASYFLEIFRKQHFDIDKIHLGKISALDWLLPHVPIFLVL
jgi:hypothetical protein